MLHRVGARAFVEDDVDSAELAALEARVEVAPVEVVGDRRAGGIVVGKFGTATVSYDELFGAGAPT